MADGVSGSRIACPGSPITCRVSRVVDRGSADTNSDPPRRVVEAGPSRLNRSGAGQCRRRRQSTGRGRQSTGRGRQSTGWGGRPPGTGSLIGRQLSLLNLVIAEPIAVVAVVMPAGSGGALRTADSRPNSAAPKPCRSFRHACGSCRRDGVSDSWRQPTFCRATSSLIMSPMVPCALAVSGGVTEIADMNWVIDAANALTSGVSAVHAARPADGSADRDTAAPALPVVAATSASAGTTTSSFLSMNDVLSCFPPTRRTRREFTRRIPAAAG